MDCSQASVWLTEPAGDEAREELEAFTWADTRIGRGTARVTSNRVYLKGTDRRTSSTLALRAATVCFEGATQPCAGAHWRGHVHGATVCCVVARPAPSCCLPARFPCLVLLTRRSTGTRGGHQCTTPHPQGGGHDHGNPAHIMVREPPCSVASALPSLFRYADTTSSSCRSARVLSPCGLDMGSQVARFLDPARGRTARCVQLTYAQHRSTKPGLLT